MENSNKSPKKKIITREKDNEFIYNRSHTYTVVYFVVFIVAAFVTDLLDQDLPDFV